MKSINAYFINNSTYLKNILDKYKCSAQEYEQYSRQNMCVCFKDITPYTFTLSKLTDVELENFKIFYTNYLVKSEIYEGTIDDLCSFIQNDIVRTITFILAAQYYFL